MITWYDNVLTPQAVGYGPNFNSSGNSAQYFTRAMSLGSTTDLTSNGYLFTLDPAFVASSPFNPFTFQRDFALDAQQTSSVRAFGDHDCYHRKVTATLMNSENPWRDLSDIESSMYAHKSGANQLIIRPLKSIGSTIFPLISQSGVWKLLIPFNWLPNFEVAIRYSNPGSCWRTGQYWGSNNAKGLAFDYGYNLKVVTFPVVVPSTDTQAWYYRISCGAMLGYDNRGTGSNDVDRWSLRHNAGLLTYYVDNSNKGHVEHFTDATLVAVSSLSGAYSYTKSTRKASGTLAIRTAYDNVDYGVIADDLIASRIVTYYKSRFAKGYPKPRTSWYYPSNTWTLPKVGITQQEYLLSRDVIWRKTRNFWSFVPYPTDPELGIVAASAAEQAKYLDINSIAYLRDLPSIVTTLRQILLAIKSIASNPAMTLAQLLDPKTWASLHLESKYGITLTLEDTRELISAISKATSSTNFGKNGEYLTVNYRSLSKTVGRYQCDRVLCYKLYYDPADKGILGILKKLQDWDLYPDFQNLWDLVPYSFVIDWFVDVETLLNRLDTINYYQYLRIRSCLWSSKDTYVIPASNFVLPAGCRVTNVSLSRYKRKTRGTPHYPPLSLELGSGIKNHILEAGALIVQRF